MAANSNISGAIEIEAGRTQDLKNYSEEDIALAKSRRPIVEAIITKKGRTKSDVIKAATSLEISDRQLYTIMKAYVEDPGIPALIGAKRGRKRGTRLLNPVLEAIIADAIESKYSDKTRRDVHFVIRHIKAECRLRKLKPPSINTIKSRIDALDDRKLALKREGYKVARDRYSAVNEGMTMPSFVLDAVMIDHTKADIIIVDEESRLPIGRPYMTIAIDVRSRAILALILRLSAPSAMTNSLAVHMCSTPKDGYISRLGIDAKWIMYGIPRKLSLDNGSDFRGNALKFGCEKNLIDIDFRPVAHPSMGGIVERSIQTINRETHQLPGTTKGDVGSKKGYNAEEHACLTLRDLERILTLFITRQYHERIHQGIGMSPLRAWQEGTAGGDKIVPAIRTPQDPRRFLIDFLDYKELPITRRGFNFRGIYYNDDILTAFRLKDKKRKYVVRRDPRSISRIFAYIDNVYPPRYLEIAPVDRTLPDISEEEWLERRKRRKLLAERGVNYESMAQAHFEAEEIVEKAQSVKKSVRTANARRKHNAKSAKAVPSAPPDTLPKNLIVETTNDSFDPDKLAEFLDDSFDGVDPL